MSKKTKLLSFSAQKKTATGKRSPGREWLRRYLPPLFTFTLLIVGMEVLLPILKVKVYVLPQPHVVLEDLWVARDLYIKHAALTLAQAVTGALIGSFVGFSIAIVLTLSRLLERGCAPIIVASNSIPILAIAPILIMWLGAGSVSKVAVAAFLCFFPVCINSIKGLHSVEVVKRDLFHSYAASNWQTFFKLRLPSSLPFVFTGLKITGTSSVIATIVAQFVGSNAGLGYLILRASFELDTPRVWGSVVLASALGIAFYGFIGLVERWVVRWRNVIEVE